jgi:hypothetical protein
VCSTKLLTLHFLGICVIYVAECIVAICGYCDGRKLAAIEINFALRPNVCYAPCALHVCALMFLPL